MNLTQDEVDFKLIRVCTKKLKEKLAKQALKIK